MKREYRPQRKAIGVVAAFIVAGLGASGAAAAEGDAAHLAAERARWEAAEPGDYRYAYQKYCECYRDEPPVTVVTVRAGRAEQVHHRFRSSGNETSENEVPVDETQAEFYWTIDELFDRLASALERDAIVRAEYDAELGYPTSLFIDDDPDAFGGEIDFRNIEVELL